MFPSFLVTIALLASPPVTPAEGPALLIDANTLRPIAATPGVAGAAPREERTIQLTFDHNPLAWDGQPVPGGGTLVCDGWFNPAAVNNAGQMVFYAQIAGSQRNQGYFVADASGLHPIAIGCGDIGGGGNPGPCGDPTPVGGKFAGMFGGSFIVPTINDNGDVLFLSDIYQGPGLRGLFLYRAAEDDIVKVAVFGDPSPLGGTITGLGPGSINNSRQVVFFAETNDAPYPDIFLYQDGVLSVVAAMGQPAPQGGTFDVFCLEAIGWSDGTLIPTGTLPDINDAGDIAFYAWVANGYAECGIFVSHNGIPAWRLYSGQPSPLGGHYTDFYAPSINNRGALALLAEIQLASGQNTSAWIAGQAPIFHKVLAFYDPLDGGQVWVLAVSRNPVNVIDDCGNVAVWCQVNIAGNWLYRMLIVDPYGQITVVAREGDASPLGGTLGRLQAWPSFNSFGQIAFGTEIYGGSSGTAQLLSQIGNLPGDANNDGKISTLDWTELPGALGRPDACTPRFRSRVFDFEGDNDVDLRDVAGFQTVFE